MIINYKKTVSDDIKQVDPNSPIEARITYRNHLNCN